MDYRLISVLHMIYYLFTTELIYCNQVHLHRVTLKMKLMHHAPFLTNVALTNAIHQLFVGAIYSCQKKNKKTLMKSQVLQKRKA